VRKESAAEALSPIGVSVVLLKTAGDIPRDQPRATTVIIGPLGEAGLSVI
jgi:hypothetical protein